ncbi:MAG: 2-hydroxycyclohexanecarboxyl-CoA dehydrogenase [Chloroflexota bacterium]|jgi:3-oxoacyl-[acyl-carrier protein] reductase|nr:2-hydroxycyclohexanecarboxyl-CoA dehydrogenase [Chloroflexota bacterium]
MAESAALTRRVAVVNGGAGGIGQEVVLALARDGFHVVILDVSETACQEAVARLAQAGGTGEYRVLDLTRKPLVAEAFAGIRAAHGRIDALVNLAGGTLHQHPIQEFPLAEWQRVIDVNLKATFLCCQAVIPGMKARGMGAIVNTASNYGVTGGARRTAYAASKAAIMAFSKSLALELAPHGIRVNTIAPGRTATARVMGNYDPEEWEAKGSEIPMGRAAEPAEIADGVAFLVSDASGYMTGQTLHVNGGMVLP